MYGPLPDLSALTNLETLELTGIALTGEGADSLADRIEMLPKSLKSLTIEFVDHWEDWDLKERALDRFPDLSAFHNLTSIKFWNGKWPEVLVNHHAQDSQDINYRNNPNTFQQYSATYKFQAPYYSPSGFQGEVQDNFAGLAISAVSIENMNLYGPFPISIMENNANLNYVWIVNNHFNGSFPGDLTDHVAFPVMASMAPFIPAVNLNQNSFSGCLPYLGEENLLKTTLTREGGVSPDNDYVAVQGQCFLTSYDLANCAGSTSTNNGYPGDTCFLETSNLGAVRGGLLAFFEAMNGDSWDFYADCAHMLIRRPFRTQGHIWNPNTDPCKDRWPGIACDVKGNVVKLLLSGQAGWNLKGKLPENMGDMLPSSLRVIDLSFNELTGPLPDFSNLAALERVSANRVLVCLV